VKVQVTDEIWKQIERGSYVPRSPDRPIPKGIEDCFGKYRDMSRPECKSCEESDPCNLVQIRRQMVLSPRKEGGG
jgi:hypothetical protein